MTIFKNSKEGAKNLANFLIQEIENIGIEKFKIDDSLDTIFIAGAPGAGKTEFLETILDSENYVVIDIDKYRKYFEGYNGKNAREYQNNCSRVATIMFDYCLKNELKIIFDGTLSSEISLTNVSKSVKKGRKIGIVLIYQDPLISYSYTIARQINNERQVDIDSFIRIYYNSIKYTFEMVEKYSEIELVIGAKKRERERNQILISSKEEFDKIYKVEYNTNKLKGNLQNLIFNLGMQK